MGGSLKRSFITLLTVAFVLGGSIIGYVLFDNFPEYWFSWYPAIPALFFLIGVIQITTLEKNRNSDPQSLVTLYMIFRLAKMGVTAMLAILYYLLDGEKMMAFIVTLGLFYFIYLGIETWGVFRFEQSLKAKE